MIARCVENHSRVEVISTITESQSNIQILLVLWIGGLKIQHLVNGTQNNTFRANFPLKMLQSGITDRRRVQLENPLLSLGGKCNHVASN